MSTQRNEAGYVDVSKDGRLTPRGTRAVWAVALLFAAPFVAGAKGCDPGVVGDECPKGNAAARSARCGGNTGDAGPGDTPPDSGATPVSCGGIAGLACPANEYCNFPPSAACGVADQTGTCAPKPQVCTEQYAPVCGCDGKTYGNACTTAGAGISVAHSGECTTTKPPPVTGSDECGGLLGKTCGKGQYCLFPAGSQCGAADQTGTCTDTPTVCDLVFHAVCGCDGKTYGNDCEAASHGTSVASDGPCAGSSSDAGAPPVLCGGIAGRMCPTGEYCEFPNGHCGASDQGGTCAPQPQVCDAIGMPVCGCDGKTYGNACEAASVGISVAAQGACSAPPTGTTCGGLRGATCAKGEYCNFPLSARCGSADATGTCAATPSSCTKEYVPVCGCDGNTYGNACMAAAAGTAVSAMGPCGSDSGQSCGSRGLPACPSGQFCKFPASAMCGAADAPGACAAIPQACTLEFAPVCGCDGKTYSNQCAAWAAGQSVASNGGCTAP